MPHLPGGRRSGISTTFATPPKPCFRPVCLDTTIRGYMNGIRTLKYPALRTERHRNQLEYAREIGHVVQSKRAHRLGRLTVED